MKICVFSDAHGNKLFFDEVLKRMEKENPERFYFLGDSVSYFPDGNYILTRLKEIHAVCIQGNHESMLLGRYPFSDRKDEVYHLRRTLATISPENLSFAAGWPSLRKTVIDGKHLMFVHGTPDNPMKGYGYEDSAVAEFDDPAVDILYMGHTHRPWIKQNQHTLVVNVGSVGLPRDMGANPSFALTDTVTGKTEIIRTRVSTDSIFKNPGDLSPAVLECLQRREKFY